MTPETTEPPFQLREYVRVLRAHRWLLVVTVAVTTVSALAVSLRTTPMYASNAKVLVKPITATQQLLDATSISSLSLETEREVASSASVASIAGSALESGHSTEELLEHLQVSVPADTQVLEVTYTDPSPLVAQRTAQAFADAYLEFKRRAALTTYNTVLASIRERIAPLQRELERARFTSNRTRVGSPAHDRAENKISLVAGEIALLRNQMASLATLDFDPGAVIQPADLPDEPSSPKHVVNAFLGFVVGLALGVGFALLRERFDDRIRGREDLEEQIGAPTLVAIPKVDEWRDRRSMTLVTQLEPRGAAAEAYKTLRTNVLFNAAQRGLKTLMVSSATAGEGKTMTAANLATVLAQAGKRVILVSADLRKPGIGQFFETNGRPANDERGLSMVLTGSLSLQEALRPTDVKGLWLLDTGPVPANPAEMAQSPAMATLLEALRSAADLTIIDTAPALVVTDALAMAPHVDGILFVAYAGSTTRQAVVRARVQFEHVGGRIIGALLNAFDPSRAADYGYGYHYRHVYRYRDEESVEGRAAFPG